MFLTEEDLNISNNQTTADIVDGKSNPDEDEKLIYARMKGKKVFKLCGVMWYCGFLSTIPSCFLFIIESQ